MITLPAYLVTSSGVVRLLKMLERKSSPVLLSRVLPVAGDLLPFQVLHWKGLYCVCTHSRTSFSDPVKQVCPVCGYIICHILQSRVKDFVNTVTYSALISGKVHPRV